MLSRDAVLVFFGGGGDDCLGVQSDGARRATNGGRRVAHGGFRGTDGGWRVGSGRRSEVEVFKQKKKENLSTKKTHGLRRGY